MHQRKKKKKIALVKQFHGVFKISDYISIKTWFWGRLAKG